VITLSLQPNGKKYRSRSPKCNAITTTPLVLTQLYWSVTRHA
jgi:hypothetical protein